MIISASRRTDIPSFYGDWFINNLKKNKFYTVNPYNEQLVSEINITKDNLDMIVFWTKDCINFMKHIPYLINNNIPFFFHYTITSYSNDIELLQHSKNDIINNFIELSNLIGKDRLILRYDPIIITEKYTVDYHIKAYEKLISKIKGYTNTVIFSFLQVYTHNKDYLYINNLRVVDKSTQFKLIKELAAISKKYNIKLKACSNPYDFTSLGVEKAACVDYQLIEKLRNKPIKKNILDNTRDYCLCTKVIDIGQYQTCKNGCKYCYATNNRKPIKTHNHNMPIISGDLKDKIIKERKDTDTLLTDISQLSLDI